jgi:hypothetical protein
MEFRIVGPISNVEVIAAGAESETSGASSESIGEDYLYSKKRFVQIDVPATVKASIRRFATA